MSFSPRSGLDALALDVRLPFFDYLAMVVFDFSSMWL